MLRTLALCLLAPAAPAADIVVGPGGSIQTAIDAAVDGDRVLVQPGTYFEAIDLKGKKIEVIGLEGALKTTIDATGLNLPVVTLHAGENDPTTVQGFTLTGGRHLGPDGWGGGVSAISPSLVRAGIWVEDCIVRDNLAEFGGGMAGNLRVRRTTIRDNASAQDGGGVWGLSNLSRAVVARNTALGRGGGFFVDGGASAGVTNSVFAENASAAPEGGGMFVVAGSAAVLGGVVMVENRAGSDMSGLGGAIYVETSGVSLIVNCTIVDNRTPDVFGTVGGIYGPSHTTSSILWGNDGQQIAFFSSISYSDVEGILPGTGVGNIDALPLFVDPSSSGRDYHLDFLSPCIDTGNPGSADADGSVVDMGAFSYATFYARANTLPAHWQDPAWPEISAQVGGKARFKMHAKFDPGADYLMLGSITGTSPGTPIGGVVLPLTPDPWLLYTLQNPNTPPLFDSFGVLDASGEANPTIVVPPALPALAGAGQFTAWHAAVAGDAATQTATLATNAAPLLFLP